MIPDRTDVVVVGAGNAAMCAALAARDAGAQVLVLESASEAERGGNTRYAAGQLRVGFGHAKNLARVVEGLDSDALANVGGLFYHNYPGGSGLTAGGVFGRIAGQGAAQHSKRAAWR